MGWIIATIVLGLLWVGTTFLAGHIIMNLFTRHEQFEDELESRIDTSLQVLDNCFMEIAMVANKPVFFDSPEVRAVVSAIQRARVAVLDVTDIFKDIRFHGFWITSWLKRAKYEEIKSMYEKLVKIISERKMDIPVAKTYTLEFAGEALEHAQEGSRNGKILFVMNGFEV